MQCPYCRADNDRVIDSRSAGDGVSIRRRRECLGCGQRFTTYERPDVAPRMVVKKDGSRECFSREKILRGMITACEKRHITLDQLNKVVDSIEQELFDGHEREVDTASIGERVSQALRDLDQVAYVRFTSVYREFADINEFLEALTPLLKKDRPHGRDPGSS
jgi:transcriptional repressor NrdR